MAVHRGAAPSKPPPPSPPLRNVSYPWLFPETSVRNYLALSAKKFTRKESVTPRDTIMASPCAILRRGIATTCIRNGKRNFRKFLLYGKRGSRSFKERQMKNPDPDIPVDNRGTRPTGYQAGDRWIEVPEMIPELIVPSLEGFTLKPYVSYKAEGITEPEFTPQDLFDVVYSQKVREDFMNDQLDENGEPLNPSEYEKLTSQQAKDQAERVGHDIFDEKKPL